ncbi:GDSL-type esterase/lipase family protein [Chitinophaga horti]|uniref:GDSL-type esterase/lipase family protein n=1 Tax=Chitinophaga horti TaxID=2920382 RepID=A0ABY6IYF6_9BACT|nr:GDSL-type esterase/lipase family protein [Chitinophaga horti]UYQ92415.1 GDSL-type esterase/lipase family protein [Chitinophaga horti]
MNKLFTLLLVLLTSALSTYGQTCTDKGFTIVILGSSSAAGYHGPTHIDSSWVKIFERQIRADNPLNMVRNLAEAGTTTYFAQPSWYKAPVGRPVASVEKNITRALKDLKADAVVVNFPSNDAAQSIPVAEQQANFNRIVAAADSLHVPVWITSTQPRTTMYGVSRAPLMLMRDWLANRFGSRYINFWDPFATAEGKIVPEYAIADSIHLNNAAHRIMAQRVIAEHILDTLCAGPVALAKFTTRFGEVAKISWTTTAERYVTGFQLQGRSEGGAWKDVGAQVPSTSNGYDLQEYAQTDTEALPYYRLKITDAKNRVFYSPVLEAKDSSEFIINNATITTANQRLKWSWNRTKETWIASAYILQWMSGRWEAIDSIASGQSAYELQSTAWLTGGTYVIAGRTLTGKLLHGDTLVLNAPDEKPLITGFQVAAEGASNIARFTASVTAPYSVHLEFPAGATGNWSAIDKKQVPVNGNYDLRDTNPHSGAQYRLRMVNNNNGSTYYSDVITLGEGFALGALTIAKIDYHRTTVNWNTVRHRRLKELTLQVSADSANWRNVVTYPSAAPYTYTFTDTSFAGVNRWYRVAGTDSANGGTFSAAVKALPDPLYLDPFRSAIGTITAPSNIPYTITRNKMIQSYVAERSINNGESWEVMTNTVVTGGFINDDRYYDADVWYRISAIDSLGRQFAGSHGVYARGDAPFRVKSFTGYGDWGSAMLSWTTEYERKAKQISVVRSSDLSNWQTVNATPIATAGNSTSPVQYSYIDPNVAQVTLFYRLVLEDSAGRRTLTPIIEVNPDTLFALPYRLASLTGTQEGNRQTIKWQVSVEKNMRNITVDRSNDGTNWTALNIDLVAARGEGVYKNVTYERTYTYNISGTTNAVYYRLRYMDVRNRYFTVPVVVKIVADSNFATPIHYASVSAVRNLDKQTVSWSTSKEWNSSEFIVQRNVDFSGWNALEGRVKAAEMSNTTKHYTFEDTSYTPRQVQYRVVMLDAFDRVFNSPAVAMPVDSNYNRYFRVGSFSGVRDGRTQVITWTTTKEFFTTDILIERNHSNAWVRVDSVPAAGISMTDKPYTFTDKEYNHKDIYYRLTFRDKYKRTERSNEALVKIDSNYVTPVRFGGQSVKRELDKQVIAWNTTKEFGLVRFNILRLDGNTWTRIDSVPAKGAGDYTFTDNEYKEKETYYRLQVRDEFGRGTLTNEMFVRIDSNYNTPVRYGAVTGAREGETQVISWSTLKEFRTKSFDVERKNADNSWLKIGTVNAAGIDMDGQSYSFTDTEGLPAAQTYRVVMTDLFDRATFISPEVKLAADSREAAVFKNFTVTRESEKSILKWTTASEYGSLRFVIERSNDGNAWTRIDSLPAAGKSSADLAYSFTDAYVANTVWAHYRVLAVGVNGTRTPGESVKVVVLITSNPTDPQPTTGQVYAYPNPASGSFKIHGFATGVHTEVYNSRGVLVYRNTQYAGEAINTESWPAGIYYIQLNKGRYRITLIKI